MATPSVTPSSNAKMKPSSNNSPSSSPRCAMRGRSVPAGQLSLRRVVGTTCSSPTGFDSVASSFAYIAGGAVVVVDVASPAAAPVTEQTSQDDKTRVQYTQRFFRARPTAVPVCAMPRSPTPAGGSSALTSKANDSRARAAVSGLRDTSFNNSGDMAGSPSGRTWTSRERIKAATCLSLSRDARYLAVGETGYAPRVLIFNLQDSSSDVPLVSISEHGFGVRAVSWSQDTRFLASLGASNDGFIYVWKVDPKTGAAKFFQQNRCTANVRGMVWMGTRLVTLGVRHMKSWRIEEAPQNSPAKAKFDSALQRPLPGRSILLGTLLEATFTCAATVDDDTAIVCTDAGHVCLLDNSSKQMKLTNVLDLDFPISSITIREGTAFVGGKAGQFATLTVRGLVDSTPDSILTKTETCTGVVALGFLTDHLVTIDCNHSIDIWDPAYRPGQPHHGTVAHTPIPGHGESILGVQSLGKANALGGAFVTWSGSGKITVWDLEGRMKGQLDIPVEQSSLAADMGLVNQVTCVCVTRDGKHAIVADKLGVVRIIDSLSGECLLDTKAHSADCQSISIYEDETKFVMASCGRDRSTQLFCRRADGSYRHFQTLEFTSRVAQVLIPSADRVITCSLDRTVQVYHVIPMENEPDILGAVSSRVITLKASPTSMAMGSDGKSVFVSLLDRSVTQYDIASGKQMNTFRCCDESSAETVALESLSVTQLPSREQDLVVGISNTDKSVRVYDGQSGDFLDREWGHTEAISGATLVGLDGSANRRIVSVGSDGTIMLWSLESADTPPAAVSRDPSPVKDGVSSTSTRPTVRRVLSKAELVEFQKAAAWSGRRSPPRMLRHKASRTSLAPAVRMPSTPAQYSSSDDAPSRSTRAGNGGCSGGGSPPDSPRSGRRPPLSAMATTTTTCSVTRRKSWTNLRGSANANYGPVNIAMEQVCRNLRSFRKKVSTSLEAISAEALAELNEELQLTAAVLGERSRDKPRNDTALAGLLDMYSERIMSMLDQKLNLGKQVGSKVTVDDDMGVLGAENKEVSDLEPDSPSCHRRPFLRIGDEAAAMGLLSPSPSP